MFDTTQSATAAPLDEGAAPEPRTVRRKLFNRTCPECSVAFKAGRDSHFCSVRCKDTWHNRNAKRGKVAMPLLLAWRAKRGSGDVAKYALGQLAALADQWNAEDRTAGRRSAESFVARKMAQGWRAVDLEPGD